MKTIPFLSLILILTFCGIAAQEPTFSEEALNDTLLGIDGNEVQFKTIIEQNKGHVVLIDIWATWCKDCIVGMPIVRKLKKDYPKVKLVYISLDRNEVSWRKGIKRFEIEEGLHFWAEDGWESELFKSIDLDWIPRYMILDEHGKIKLYRAIKASDKEIVKQLSE